MLKFIFLYFKFQYIDVCKFVCENYSQICKFLYILTITKKKTTKDKVTRFEGHLNGWAVL